MHIPSPGFLGALRFNRCKKAGLYTPLPIPRHWEQIYLRPFFELHAFANQSRFIFSLQLGTVVGYCRNQSHSNNFLPLADVFFTRMYETSPGMMWCQQVECWNLSNAQKSGCVEWSFALTVVQNLANDWRKWKLTGLAAIFWARSGAMEKPFSILPGSVPTGDEVAIFCGATRSCPGKRSALDLKHGPSWQRKYTPDSPGLPIPKDGCKKPPPKVPKPPPGYKRKLLKLRRDLRLANFLQDHGFFDPCKPAKSKKSSCFSPKDVFFPKDTLYPIHIAAKLGDSDLVRVLLSKGADPEQKSSFGRTPAEIAQAADHFGSHDMVLMLLDKVTVSNLRHAVGIMESWRVWNLDSLASPFERAANCTNITVTFPPCSWYLIRLYFFTIGCVTWQESQGWSKTIRLLESQFWQWPAACINPVTGPVYILLKGFGTAWSWTKFRMFMERYVTHLKACSNSFQTCLVGGLVNIVIFQPFTGMINKIWQPYFSNGKTNHPPDILCLVDAWSSSECCRKDQILGTRTKLFLYNQWYVNVLSCNTIHYISLYKITSLENINKQETIRSSRFSTLSFDLPTTVYRTRMTWKIKLRFHSEN